MPKGPKHKISFLSLGEMTFSQECNKIQQIKNKQQTPKPSKFSTEKTHKTNKILGHRA